MQVLDHFVIPGTPLEKHIEICQGDLTALSPPEAADLVVISAFPDDYTPTARSLVGALAQKGVSVEELATRKCFDLRQFFSCWLSENLESLHPGLNIRQILCFEPAHRGHPTEVVGDIFRALAPFMAQDPAIHRVAMPIVAAGDQQVPVRDMLFPLLDAAVRWMAAGFSMRELRIVERDPRRAEEIAQAFAERKSRYRELALSGFSGPREYDVFLSYSQQNSPDADYIYRTLRSARPELRVFMDRESIRTGDVWASPLYRALASAHKVVPLYTEQYVASKACQEEFSLAFNLQMRGHESLLHPFLVRSTPALDQDPRKGQIQYRNCTEGSKRLMRAACEELIDAIPAA